MRTRAACGTEDSVRPGVSQNRRHGLTPHQSSVVAFAGSYKSLFGEWDEWEQKFDSLLAQMYCRAAEAQLFDDVDGRLQISYGCDDGWKPEIEPKLRRWRKWRTNRDGVKTEEQGLTGTSSF